jgi:hypothetical protein
MSISPNPHNIEVQETSPDEVWESIEQAAAETEAEGTEDFFAEVDGDPKSAPVAVEQLADNVTASAETAETAKSESSATDAHSAINTADESAASALPVPGDGDWMVDPETGEVVERPAVLAKLGWTEFPKLPENPTKEDLDKFEEKLDQIVDRITAHQLAIAKYQEQLEKRIKPRQGAIDWWSKVLEPLAIDLAEKRLPRYKSGTKQGQFSKKTLHLSSGSIEFEKGGGYSFHDYNEFKAYVKAQGVEKFKEYGAEEAVILNYNKIRAAVRAGKFPDAPGVKHEQEKALASINVTRPDLKKKKGQDEVQDGN